METVAKLMEKENLARVFFALMVGSYVAFTLIALL